MFLAWKEIKHSKTRFSLIIGVMVLVSYLVFFLVGLAYGLAQDNRT
ncbi:MAG: ABC transporter permease, partial [Trichococcus flocculiformis]